jgi:hypothetical protein
MSLRTQERIDAEIKKLQEIRPLIKPCSAFGDDHWKAIDGQIEVLENCMDEDEVNDICDSEDRAENVRDAMREAAEWLDGYAGDNGEDTLVTTDGWKSLLPKEKKP